MRVVKDETPTRDEPDDGFQCAPVGEKPSTDNGHLEPKSEAEEHALEEAGYGYGV
jgi:hypothetical protein